MKRIERSSPSVSRTALGIALSSAIGLCTTAYAAEIRVPEDKPTIQACIDSAAAGDTCSVAPGHYTENAGHVVRGAGVHVLVSKPVTIVARELYQSTLDGQGSPGAFFGVDASAEIRGFVIQNVGFGIIQLNALNAIWNVRNVILRNVSYGIAVDGPDGHQGFALVANVVVDSCSGAAFYTNDADGMEVRNSIASNCNVGFLGHEHNSFPVSYSLLHELEVARQYGVRAQDLPAFGTGVFEADPQFLTAVVNGRTFPYLLRCSSPAIDAGDPADVDASGAFGLGTNRSDIGAYGGPGAVLAVSDDEKLALLAAAGCDVTVFSSNFENGMPPEISGAGGLEGVQRYAGLGAAGNSFAGQFLRNDTTGATTLTLTNLPPHTHLDIDFLFAAIDSWDGSSGSFPSGDFFAVGVDDVTIFNESFENSNAGFRQTYVPPAGGELARKVDLGFSTGVWWNDSAYDMSIEPRFHGIPHTASTATITFSAAGDGWQGGTDESWAIENLRVGISNAAAVDLPELSIGDASVVEGNLGLGNAVFTIALSATSTETVTVAFGTADGSAVAGDDYTAGSGILTFDPGETTKTLVIGVIGDTAVEPDEIFFVNLSNPTNAVILDGQGAGTIVNDDLPPAVIEVTESITVSDAPALLPAAQISVAESIAVADAPALLPAAMISVGETIAVTDAPGVFNTPTGTNVVSKPVAADGTTPVSLRFASVTAPGVSALTLSSSGPTRPPGFRHGTPLINYNLTTTATFAGDILVCINHGGTTFTPDAPIRLFHFENGAWMDHTTSVDAANTTVCGTVTSLSPFALFSVNRPPTAEAGGPYTVDEGSTVSLAAAGSDPDGDTVTFEWDLDGDGTFEIAGDDVTFDAADLDGPATRTVSVRADDGDATNEAATASVTVVNVPPTIIVEGETAADEGQVLTLLVTATDPGRADVVTLEGSDLLAGLAFEPESGNPARGTLRWRPAFTQSGSYALTFTARDDDGDAAASSLSLTVNEAGQPIIAAAQQEGRLAALIDAQSNQVVRLIDTARKPEKLGLLGMGEVALGPAKLYVLGPRSVEIFAGPAAPDPANAFDFNATARFELPGAPEAIAPTPDERQAWIALGGRDALVVLDRATDAVLTTVPFKRSSGKGDDDERDERRSGKDDDDDDEHAKRPKVLRPAALAFSPDGRFAYVAASDSHNLVVVDTALALTQPEAALLWAIPVGNRPVAVAVHPSGSTVYVANRNGNNVAVVDVSAVAAGGPPVLAALVRVGDKPEGIVISGDGNKLYVLNRNDDDVTVLETLAAAPFVRKIGRIAVGEKPSSIAITRPGSFADRDLVYVGSRESNTMSVIDTRTDQVVATIPFGARNMAPGVVPTVWQ